MFTHVQHKRCRTEDMQHGQQLLSRKNKKLIVLSRNRKSQQWTFDVSLKPSAYSTRMKFHDEADDSYYDKVTSVLTVWLILLFA